MTATDLTDGPKFLILEFVQNQTLIPILSIFIAATGISLVFKDYFTSLLGRFILRRIRQVKPGVRIKVLVAPTITITRNVITFGSIRTSLHEVDDGERLPSVRTGRILKVGLYQKDDRLIIHGIFKVRTQEAGDVRGRILRSFLQRRHSRHAMTHASSPVEKG
jgi:hypothetical protein